MTVPKLRRMFFSSADSKSTKSSPTLQNLWKRLEKKDVHGCVDISASDKLLQDQFVVGIKATPVRSALQEWVKVQPSVTFNDIIVEEVVQEQEDAEVNVAVTKKHELLYST